MKKRGLGKGFEALLGSETVAALQDKTSQTRMLALVKLSPNPHQPRRRFDEAAIAALTDSIRQHGIIQPLAVRPLSADADGNERFEIIAGERRYRAAKQAGLSEVPVVIHDISDADSAAFALIENLQREDLNIMEKANGMQQLIQTFGLTHAACGKVLGQSRSSVSNTLRLLELSDVVQQALIDKSIDMGHARALLAVEHAEQYELLQQIRLNGLSVRETDVLVRNAQESQATEATPARRKKSDYIKQAEIKLSEQLQTKVNISLQSGGNGKITLAFSDQAMLEKLASQLGFSS